MELETGDGGSMGFAQSESEFRCLFQPPSQLVLEKCLSELDQHCRDFIAHSPFLCLGTAAANGDADVSPRGDAPGFVQVLTSQTLLIPDRPGNNRLDSMSNLAQNPHVGLIFFVPGVDETLRVNGRGRIVVRSNLLEQSAVGGKIPQTGILVEVREAFLQCAKALKRSRLWSDEYRPPKGRLPSLGQMLVDQTNTEMSVEQLDALIGTAYRERLY